MEIGIVGLPNVGKSSLFNALTKSKAQASNFPFTTIEPNVGVIEVPDERLDYLADFYKSNKKINAYVKFVDIAGLVKGASQGEGLGNKFLDHIRSVDAIIEVVRCFSDPQVIHVAGNSDPLDDILTINTELILSDLEQLERIIDNLKEKAKRLDKDANKRILIIEQAIKHLSQGLSLRQDQNLCFQLKEYNLLSAKPLLYLINTDENTNQQLIEQITTVAIQEGAKTVRVSVKSELEIMDLSTEEQHEFRQGLGIISDLDDVITSGYQLLDLETFFTAGEKESRAWTIKKNTKAPQAGGRIHSDFEKGFIRAEVFSFEDLKKYRSKKAIKDHGRLRSEGRDYIVQDGDVIEFLFNV